MSTKRWIFCPRNTGDVSVGYIREEVVEGSFHVVADVYHDEAFGRLIASAPDLLAERDRFRARLEDAHDSVTGMVAIIALAREVGMTAEGIVAKLVEALTEMGEELGAALRGAAPAIHSEDCTDRGADSR